MSNQFPGEWEGGKGWGRHGGHHGNHGGHHGRDGHHGGHRGHRQRRGCEEEPLAPNEPGFYDPRRHHGHHGWRGRHREQWETPHPPPMWNSNGTGYSWNYGFNPPPTQSKPLEQPSHYSQNKIAQMPNINPKSEGEAPLKLSSEREPPSYIVCPIAQTVMESPALLMTCGHTFDQNHIRLWIKKSKNCPICKKECNETHIIKNFSLVEAIDRYRTGK